MNITILHMVVKKNNKIMTKNTTNKTNKTNKNMINSI